jgi:putative nucleotidyltransferase with HDIG domain
MTDSDDNKDRSALDNAGLNPPESDWASTIENLMALARDVARKFEFDQAVTYLNTVEQIWDSKGLPEYSRDLRFELHSEKGKAYASMGKLEEAVEEYQKVLNHCRESGHMAVKAETFSQIGQLLGKQGDHDRALGYHQRAIGAYRRLEDKPGLCKALRNLGVTYIELGEFEEAEDTYKAAVAIAGQFKNKVLYADLINNLGAISNMRGNWRRALDLYRESLVIYTAGDELRKCGYTKNNLAITMAEQGMLEEAFTYFRDAFETATHIKDASLTLIVNINLADLYLRRGMVAEAREHCNHAEQHLVDNNLRNGNLVEVKKTAGKIACLENDYGSALVCFNEALAISKEIGTQYLEADVLMERGSLLRTMGRHFDALTDLDASYHIYTSLKAEGKREKTEEVIKSIETLYLEVFDAIAKEVDRKDQYTKGHSDRVASLSLLLAREVGLRGNVLKTIVAGALLHDIGKIKIENEILNKPGRLTAEEFGQIKRHPEFGIEFLLDKEFPWDLKPLILYHHEHYDGGGYPEGLKDEAIPLGARIICIADVFDALTSDRVYRKAFEPAKALAIMAEEAAFYDPMLLKCFVRMITQGSADLVINSRTRQDEMYSIWSQCMASATEALEPTPSDQPTPVTQPA